MVDSISFNLLGTELIVSVEEDKVYKHPVTGVGRLYLVVSYWAECTDTGNNTFWRGRKWYLSEHMTLDEVVKTAYAACKAAVEHEVMEAFRIGGRKVFNPHAPYEHLMTASQFEVRRNQQPNQHEHEQES